MSPLTTLREKGCVTVTKETMFASFDGTELYLKKDIPNKPKAVVVIVHGLCEHQGRYDYLTERFLARQFAVIRFDHRGHGRSKGKKVYYADFNEIVDDTNEAVKIAESDYPDLPLYVLGHSMGGFAVSLFGTKYPGRADGIVLSGALTRASVGLPSELLAMDAEAYFPNALGDGVCSDPSVVEAYVQDPYVEKEISASVYHMFDKGIDYLKLNAEKFVEPVLVMHGQSDALVPEQDSRDFYGDIGSSDKTLIIYANMMHEIFNEYEKDEVIGDTIQWIEKRNK